MEPRARHTPSASRLNIASDLPGFQGSGLAWARSAEVRSRSFLAPAIFLAYRLGFYRGLLRMPTKRLEGGEMHSTTLWRLMADVHGVRVGAYSYGPCLAPGVFPAGTSVGRYCSFAEGIRVFRRNHPVRFLSQHPFFYNSQFGLVGKDTIEDIADNPLHIGSDVWIGSGATILPGCRHIGDGAVIGAGSVVSRDVPPFAIFAGNPARFIRDRYASEVRDLIAHSRWWEFPLSIILVAAGDLLYRPIDAGDMEEFKSRLELTGATH
jgi:virginiamycin A acetyltransferase